MIRGRSLQRELPLGIGLLVVLAVGATAVAAFQEVSRSNTAAVEERLNRLATQLSGLLGQSMRTLLTGMRNIASRPNVRTFAHTLDDPPDTLRRLSQVQLVFNLEIWDRTGRTIATVGRAQPPVDSATARGMIARSGDDQAVVGPILMSDSGAFYPVIVPVLEGNRPFAYLMLRRRLSATPDGGRVLGQLIGLDGGLLIGNAAGDVWTDFYHATPAPPSEAVSGPQVHAYQRADTAVFGKVIAIENSPWLLALEMPQATVLARTRAFRWRVAAIAGIVVVVAVAVAWWASRRMTRPLLQVTEAAEAIAAGQTTTTLAVSRQDEIGRLTGAFNIMAGKVAQSHAQLEAQVAERTATLQETLHELEAFSYTVSHDLRAPLRGMQGFAQALLEDYSPQLDETGRDYARRVVDASRKMDVLIQDLLSYSRLSREQLSIGSVDLDPIAVEVSRGVEDAVNRRGGRIDIVAPLGRVAGNGRILHQMVFNLVGNAVKFVPPDVAPAVRMFSESRNGRLRLWVEDNGIGIAPEHQQRIFGVFERLHGGEAYPGTGIGLAIVRRGAERMGGDAGVESSPGRGSRFWIEVPMEDRA